MSPPRQARALAPAVAFALVLLGCGDDGEPAATTTTSSVAEATSTSTSTSTTEPDPTTTVEPGVDHGDDEEGLGDLDVLVPQLLVTAAELGPDVEDVGFRPPEDVDCGVDTDHPPDVLAGTGLQAPGQVVEETIRVYPSPEAAEAAFEAWVAFPPDCTYGLGLGMGEPVDGGEPVGADRSVVYEAVRDDGTTTLVVALVSDSLVTTAVTGTPGMDPVEVGAFAVGKVQAALES